MTSQDPLDEVQWQAPDIAKWMGGIHENTVLHYFARSHFFDPTSNNASVETQASFNPSMAYLVQTREAFEGHLKTLQGLEYVVAMGPEDFGPPAPISEGTWVIRKQNRRKRPGTEDEITVLATYFVVGQNIYMAPSIGRIIGSKILATTSALSKLFNIASSLPSYTPAQGYRYLPPSSKQKDSSGSTGQSSQASKEGTPMPDAGIASESIRGSTTGLSYSPSSHNRAADSRAIYDTFSQFLRYGDEYMDERPLVGEPGSFVFTNNKPPPETVAPKVVPPPPSPPPTVAPTPPVKETSRAASEGVKTQDEAPVKPKIKRRKSRAPTTPGSPMDLATPI